MEHDRTLEQQRLRRKIRRRVSGMLGVAFGLILVLSLPGVQARWFPAWLIRHWAGVAAGAALLAITALLLLPIVIEASLTPRRLSGPGRLSQSHRLPGDDG